MTHTPSEPARKRRWFRWVLLVFVLLLLAPLGAGYYMASAKPAYWQPLDGHKPEIRQSAEAFEQQLSSQLTRVREDQPVWKLEIDQRDVNHWLAARLPQWMANRGVDQQLLDQIAQTQLAIAGSHMELAMSFDYAGLSSVLQLRYKPQLADNKRVELVLLEAQAGMIPLPVESVFDEIIGPYMPRRQREQLDDVRKKVKSVELSVPLGDGRIVDVIGLELHDGRAVLTCRTHR